MNRRGVLKLALGVSAAAAVPIAIQAAIAQRLPVIYGDGVHDDTDGLQALFDGRPVCIATQCVHVKSDGHFVVRGGTFSISRTLSFGFPSQARSGEIENNTFEWHGEPNGCVFRMPTESVTCSQPTLVYERLPTP